jgi:hypothetical protein
MSDTRAAPFPLVSERAPGGPLAVQERAEKIVNDRATVESSLGRLRAEEHGLLEELSALRVQTEVVTREGIVLRTVVLEGGVVRFTENRTCPPEVQDMGSLIACVKSQHQEILERTRRGGAWLAST